MVANSRSAQPRQLPRSGLAGALGGRAAFAAARAAPLLDAPVMAGEQDLGHAPTAILGRPRVVRILGMALQRRAEGLLRRGLLVPEGAGQLAEDRVAEHHRGELAAAEHVAPDRDDIAGEVLHDALVEALVAAAQQRQRGLA